MIINQAALAAMLIGFKSEFSAAFAGAPRDFEKIATVVPSSTDENVYPWLGQNFQIRQWLGDKVLQNLKVHDYAIKNLEYEGTLAVLRRHLEDDILGIYKPLVQQLGQAAGTHPDTLIFGLVLDGFSKTCYDGQPFFDTDHPVGRQGAERSVSNHMGGSGTPWFLMCTSRPLKPFIFQKRKDYEFVNLDSPTDANVFFRAEYIYGVEARVNAGYGFWQMCVASKKELTPANYAEARAAMLSFVSDADEPLGLIPDLLVVPPNLEGLGRKILVNDRNDAGAANEWAGSAELLMTPWLARS
ncbi:MAG: Mu-like prophage major head subunit gpT family protein [Deltaproteobacteria bacterium]|nr:Mu-like prophage major head subunit gpT family protein [Deltaproteobacteria bacterium]